MTREAITSKHAPAALGPYSQAIRAGQTVWLSGQLGLDPATGNLADGVEAQTHQVFRNLRAVAQAAGGELADIVKLTLLLADLDDFARVNAIMTEYFTAPFPARAQPGGPNLRLQQLVYVGHFDDPAAYPGMSLRDYFAGQALASSINSDEEWYNERTKFYILLPRGVSPDDDSEQWKISKRQITSRAQAAYDIADAMIVARNKVLK